MPTLIDNTWHENDFSYFTSGMIVQVFTAFVQAKLFEEQVVTRQLLSSCLSRSPSKSLCRTCLHFSKKHLQKIYTILNITRGTNWFWILSCLINCKFTPFYYVKIGHLPWLNIRPPSGAACIATLPRIALST